MAWSRARGNVRRCAAILGAALIVAAIAPLATSAAAPGGGRFTSHVPTKVAGVTHVNARAASGLAPRRVPAAAQLKAKARPASIRVAAGNGPKTRIVKPAIAVIPPLSVVHTTNVTTQDDVLLEPPDPWVVANSSYVISSANGQVRMMNRSGSVLANVPTYALFGVDSLHYDSDPRILWDSAHGRWVGVVVTYDGAFQDTYLNLAVSDTANPLGNWTVHSISYLNALPDYPGIASTSDKIILTANLFINGASYGGTTFQAVSWASLIAGTTTAGAAAVCDTCWNGRPARNSGAPNADAYLVVEDGSTGHLWIVVIAGPGATATAVAAEDLGIANGLDAFDHMPRQPGGSIPDAGDSRIPDVVVNGDTMMFARMSQAAIGGVGNDLIIEQFVLSVASAIAGTPSGVVNGWGSPDQDYWMPGVGISNGDPLGSTGFFLSYMVPSDTVTPAAYAAGSLDGATFSDSALVASSGAPYAGSGGRWGDYMGITPDPAGNMAVWSATEVANASGKWQEVVSRLVLDDSAPSVAGTPKLSLVAGSQIGRSTVAMRITWTAATDLESGVTRYLVADELGDYAVTTGLAITKSVPWWSYGNLSAYANDYAAKGINDVGLRSTTWSANSNSFTPTVFQQTLSQVKYTGTWSSSSSSSFLGGSAKYSSTAGATATFKASGYSFGWVSYKSSTRGKARVYVDGVLKATISLKSTTSQARSIAFVANTTSGTHTIKIVVVSGRVDVDGFVVLR